MPRTRSTLGVVVLVLAAASLLGCAPADDEFDELEGGGASHPLETAGPDLCESSTQESIELLDAALDRVDRATTLTEIEALPAQIDGLFGDAGRRVASSCGTARAGSAVSELIVWASGEASSRPPTSASFAEGFVVTICELDVELTPTAKIACAG